MFDQSIVIIPTYNEVLNVQPMIEKLFALYPGLSILIIDDNSPDKTASIVLALKTVHQNLYLIKREDKLGLGTAYLEGFQWALLKKFKFIFQMDCDFSHDPHDLQRLMDEINSSNTDMAIGSRYCQNAIRIQGLSFHRLLLSYGAALMLRPLSGFEIKDMLSGFKCIKRDSLEKIQLKNVLSKGYFFQFEINHLILNADLKITEVPILFSERRMGKSKMNAGIIFEAMKVFMLLKFKLLSPQKALKDM